MRGKNVRDCARYRVDEHRRESQRGSSHVHARQITRRGRKYYYFFFAAPITSIKIFNKNIIKKILQEFVCEHKIWKSFCHNTRKQRENAVRHLSGHWPQL